MRAPRETNETKSPNLLRSSDHCGDTGALAAGARTVDDQGEWEVIFLPDANRIKQLKISRRRVTRATHATLTLSVHDTRMNRRLRGVPV